MHGWTGKILRVDLTQRRWAVESLRGDWARQFVGGRGLGAMYFAHEVDPRVDPLAPENKLIFASGPLTGTNASCGARYMVITKGALNDTITTSNSGGHWGPELKFAGYDMIIIEGRADRPVYLWVCDDAVEIREARDLWGRSVWDTEDLIREMTGVPDAKVASIGQAGENLVRFAGILNDRHRAAGRNGVGTVMGSKNLKAIGVRGTGSVSIARPADWLRAQWALKKKLKAHPVTGEGLPGLGTAVLVHVINESGAMPTKNWQFGRMRPEETGSDAENISGERLKERHTIRNKACFACTIACGRVTQISADGVTRHAVTTSPHNWKTAGEGPEYESAWALGADTNVDDMDAVLKAGAMCNEYGMDPISFGSTLAAAMEMFERGILVERETGMPLRFGSAEALLAMTETTALRRGFGAELAEGSKRLCEKYGHPECFIGSKGMEFPAYDPRAVQGMGLGYATSNRGGCHLKGYTIASEILGIPVKTDPASTAGKAALQIAFQNATGAFDASGLCLFLSFGVGVEDFLPQLVAATGVDYTLDSLLQVGERIFNLERQWLLRAGFTGADDTLPKRLLEEPIPYGPTKGQVNRLSEMLPEYYRLRGWTERGEPSREKLARLGLI
jgi:aldehyde:ferredoxin oxidoreductase